LSVSGSKAEHLLAFARRHGGDLAIVAVPRLCARLLADRASLPLGNEVWEDTRVELPFALGELRNEFTGEVFVPEQQTDGFAVYASSLLRNFPVALLTGTDHAG